MAYTAYEDVVKMVEQLSPDEQQALVVRLQEMKKQNNLSSDEWRTLLNSIKVNIPPGPAFSDRRQDWYGDDGR
jgi:hypothetical protein